MESANLWPLLGILTIVVGFLLRLNPMLVVTAGALVTGIAARLSFESLLATIGTSFVQTRNLSLVLVLPLVVIALLERHGLRERSRAWIASIRGATAARLLVAYLGARELTAAVGIASIAGQAQTVRPLLAPMVEGVVEAEGVRLDDEGRDALRAQCAAADNVGLFFGEDIFVAFGAVALMHAFLAKNGYRIAPLHIALWGIPTALCAFAIHAVRIVIFEKRLRSRT